MSDELPFWETEYLPLPPSLFDSGCKMEVIQGSWAYFPQDEILLHRNNILRSPCGTGKTTAMKGFVENAPGNSTIIAISFRKSLAYMLANSYGFTNYLDVETKIDLQVTPRVVVSIESLGRCSKNGELPLPDIMILDEYCSIIEHVFNNKTLDAVRRNLFFACFTTMLSLPNKTVILADAYFTQLDLEVFQDIAPLIPGFQLSKFRVIQNEFRNTQKTVRLWLNSNHWKSYLSSLVRKKEDKIYIFSNWKKTTDGLMAEFGDAPMVDDRNYPAFENENMLYVSSDSSQGIVSESSSNPDTLWSNYHYVFVTPTISAGVSFDVVDHFQVAFGFAGLNSTSPLGVLQQLSRVRHLESGQVELCVPHQRNGRVDYPSKEEIKEIYEKTSSWITNRHLKSLESRYIYSPQKDSLRLMIEDSSIVNVFLIRVLRSEYYASSNFLGAIQLLLENDSFNISVLENDDSTEVLKGVVSSLQDNSLQETMKAAQKYSESLFVAFDGYLQSTRSVVDSSAAYEKLKHFVQTWNALGAYGSLNIMTANVPDYTLSRALQFSSPRISHFYVNYVADDKQETFYEFMNMYYLKTLPADMQEVEIGSLSKKTKIYTFLWHLFTVCGVIKACYITGVNFLGAEIDVGLMEHDFLYGLDQSRIPTEQELTEKQPLFREIVSNHFAELDEGVLKDVDVLAEVVTLFLEHWDVIYPTFVTKKISVGSAPPECFQNFRQDKKKYQTCVSIAKVVLRKAFSYIGLVIDKCHESRINIPTLKGSRCRFRRYVIKKFDARLMLCYCRMFRDAGHTPVSARHYPCLDPFQLLLCDPKETASDLFRFDKMSWVLPGGKDTYPHQLTRYFERLFERRRTIEAREKGFCRVSETLYSTLMPTLHNVRYFWSLFRMGTSEQLPLNTFFFTRDVIEAHPLSKALYPVYQYEDGIPYMIPTYDVWFSTPEYQETGLSHPRDYYNATPDEIEEISRRWKSAQRPELGSIRILRRGRAFE